jgi:hypothetical protein
MCPVARKFRTSLATVADEIFGLARALIMSTFNHHLPLLGKYSLTPKNSPKWENTPSQNLGLAGLGTPRAVFSQCPKHRPALGKVNRRTLELGL